MIAAVRVIKDPGADNDGSTHAEKRDKASQYPEHLRASQGLLFFSNTSQCCDCEHCGALIVHRLPVIGDDVFAYYRDLSCRRLTAAIPQLRGV